MIQNYYSDKNQEGLYSKKGDKAYCWRYNLWTVLFLMFTLGSVGNLSAQVNFYGFSAGTGGVLQDMTGSTQLIGSASDDGVSAVTGIGFTFNYAGTNYTQFSANANGLVRLGSVVVTDQWTNSASNANTATPAIMPYWDDLATGTGGKVHYLLTGTAPNQRLVIEWFVTVPRATGGTAAAKFQCWLDEGSNQIKFVYGSGMITNTVNSGATIGLATATAVYNTVSLLTNTNTTSSFVTTNTQAITSGTTYTFTPPEPCDGAPTGGTVSPALSNVCTGVAPGARTVSGQSSGVIGLTYQWEQSTDGGETFADVVSGTGATTLSYTPPSFAGTDIQYRLKITCTNSGLSGYSTVSEVKGPSAPITQASAIVTSNALTSTTISWTNGNGGRRYVVVNSENSFTDPVGSDSVTVAGTAYTSGEQIVYDGTGTSVTVTGLTSGAYYVRVYEYARCTSPTVNYYNVATATNNPRQFTGPTNNDDCSNAITLPSCSGGTQTVAGTTTGATVDAIYQDCGATGTSATERGVWYKYVGDNNSVTITTCNAVGYDTRLTVYSGSCGTFTCVAGNDDMSPACVGGASAYASEVTFNAVAGTDYYVFVHGYQSGTSLSNVGNFVLTLECAPLCAPETTNDECAVAANLTIGTPLSTNNTCSSASLGVPIPTGGSNFATYYDSWYTFNSGSNTSLQISVQTGGSASVGYQLYTGTCGGTLTNVSGAVSLTGATVTKTNFETDTDYFVRVFSTSSATRGDFALLVGLPTTVIAAASCGTTIEEPFYDSFSAVAIAGAQEYEFQISNGVDTFTAVSADNSVTFVEFGEFNFTYGTTYDVSVRVKLNDVYGPYGSSCEITVTDNPLTEMHYLCGGNLPEIGSKVYFTWVPQATKYRFSVTNTTTMVEEFVENAARYFYMNSLPNFAAGTVYSVKAQVEIGGVYTDFGPACNLTTPALPTSKLRVAYCDITLASVHSNIYADYISGATQYRFRVVNGANVQTIDRPDSRLVLSMLPSYTGSTVYTVDVAVEINGVWSDYGAACTVETPASPTYSLRAAYCGITLASIHDNIYAEYANGATQYRFRVTSGANVQIIDRTDSRLVLSMLPSYELGTTYTIDVAVEMNGSFGAYGATCNVSTPAGLPTTKLRAAYCDVILAANANIYAQYVAGATAYKFKVSDGTNEEEFEGTSNMRFYLSALNMEIEAGTTYEIQVASKINDVWSAYGDVCTVTTPGSTSRMANVADKLEIKAFPNPFIDGFSIGLNLAVDKATEIHIFDMTGKLLERRTLDPSESIKSGLGHQLASGIYNVQLIQGENIYNLKVVKK